MDRTWILIADAHHARCFERRSPDHSLNELADFMYPKTKLESEARGGDLTGAAGKGHGRTGHAGTQFEPQTDANAKERATFARQLASHLNAGSSDKLFNALVIIATSPMLGEIKHFLSLAAEKSLLRCVNSDLTHYNGLELKKRVDHALQLPD